MISLCGSDVIRVFKKIEEDVLFVYLIISFLASIVGAISGIGGGVIIKPALDSFSPFDVTLVSFLSGNTVLAMTAAALLKNRKSEIKLDKKTSSLLAAGGVVGGWGGKLIFDSLRMAYGNDNDIGATQSLILVCLTLSVLLFTLFKHRIPSYNLKKSSYRLLTGVILGGIASFLGIGGGPINLAILYLLFSMDSKTAALNSIFIIFFSQVTNLLFTIFSGNIPVFSPIILIFMILGGVSGGVLGSWFSRNMTHRQVDYLFSGVMTIIIGVSLFNFYNYLIL